MPEEEKLVAQRNGAGIVTPTCQRERDPRNLSTFKVHESYVVSPKPFPSFPNQSIPRDWLPSTSSFSHIASIAQAAVGDFRLPGWVEGTGSMGLGPWAIKDMDVGG